MKEKKKAISSHIPKLKESYLLIQIRLLQI